MRWIALILCFVGWALPANADERRIALVVGNNVGRSNDVLLRFAQRDANRVAQVMRELGGVQHDDLLLMLEPDAGGLEAAFSRVEARVKDIQGPVTLLFYYSGHSSDEGLHLGATTVTWKRVRGWLNTSKAGLRIALVDACQSGSLTNQKGLGIVAAKQSTETQQRGTALLVSTESTEVAQESLDLGGSFFTHFLVSGLRGAADANTDGRVTLAEAQTFTTNNTLRATGTWARRVQRPLFEFDISGHGDIVLSNLNAGAAKLGLAPELEGRLIITEKSTSLVVAEAEKRRGNELVMALPAGRYAAHLRQTLAIQVAEVSLPWGGSHMLEDDDFTAHSYQAVAQKGAGLNVNRNRLRLGGGVQSGAVRGVGFLPVVRLGYTAARAPFEIGFRLQAGRRDFSAVDTNIGNDVIGGGLLFGWEVPLRYLDFRIHAIAELLYWHQRIEQSDNLNSLVPGGGLGAGFRIPLLSAFFFEASGEAIVYFLKRTDESSAAVTIAGFGDLGVMF